jgi:hypothetical protein
VSPLTPVAALNWLNVVATLISVGVATEQQVVAAIKSHRGLTDADTLAADDADLVALHDTLMAIRARASFEANRTA